MNSVSDVVFATLAVTFTEQPTVAQLEVADLPFVLQVGARVAQPQLRRGHGGWVADDADFVSMAAFDKVGRRVQRVGGMGFLQAPEAALVYFRRAVLNLVRDDRDRHRGALTKLERCHGAFDWQEQAHVARVARMRAQVESGGLVRATPVIMELDGLVAQAKAWLLDELLVELAARRPGIADRLAVLRAWALAREGAAPEARFAERFGAPWSPALRSKMQRARVDVVQALEALCRESAAALWCDATDLADPAALFQLYAQTLALGVDPRGASRPSTALRLGRAAVARLWVESALRDRSAGR